MLVRVLLGGDSSPVRGGVRGREGRLLAGRARRRPRGARPGLGRGQGGTYDGGRVGDGIG